MYLLFINTEEVLNLSKFISSGKDKKGQRKETQQNQATRNEDIFSSSFNWLKKIPHPWSVQGKKKGDHC